MTVSDSANERAELEEFLDFFRGVTERKLDGLTRAQATQVVMPSGTTMLGIVKHLAWAEWRWFCYFLLGEEGEGMEIADSFVLDPADTTDSVLQEYRAACETSRVNAAATPSLDTLATTEHRVHGRVTLRWILVHMIEETARHAGHLDILRELTDGRVGD
jgi:uncharacterized damage-inducible protein DinB